MILTDRLELAPATLESTRASLTGKDALSSCIQARVPTTWPPQFLDPPALQYTLDRLGEGASQAGWWLHFVILREDRSGRTLVGSAGYKGPPSSDGTVEVGYGIVSEYQRRGYASEALQGLLAHAFSFPAVTRAIAETLPSLIPSIGVLQKAGFTLIDESSEPGVIRFELARAEYEAKPS